MVKFEVSNDLNFLANILKKDLFNGSLFDKKLLILPSDQIRSWLINSWLDSDLEIVSAVRFSTLYASIPYLLSLVKECEAHFLSALELKLLIYHFLNEMYEGGIDKALTSYLSEDRQKRLTYLSEVLSNLFQNYSIYGFDLISDLKRYKNWQEVLFYKVFYENNYSFPLKELPIKTSKKLDIKIYLFGFRYLPELYFDFFHDLSKTTGVFIYYPRITSEFWEDVQSVKQKRFIQKKYSNQNYDLQDWTLKMFETNTFLAHFGALGKRYEKTLGNYNLNFEENYFENKTKTLLGTLQNHILNLSELGESTPFDVEEEKNSISIQAVNGSKLEEVKIVYEKIQNILSDNNKRLGDVLVLAPDINQYVNHIKTIFERKNGAVDFKINDVDLSLISHLAKGLEQIFNLSDSDWTIGEILTILDNPLIQAKFQIDKSDVEYFQKILKKTRLRSSCNEMHKNELFGYADAGGTWEESFQKIIMGYATFSFEFLHDDYPQLFSHISQSDLQKIEPFFQIISSLYKDLVSINKTALYSLDSCAALLVDLIQKYFFISDDAIESMTYEFIQTFCLKLKQLDQKIAISLQNFRALLTKELSKKKTTLHSGLCDAVQFGSFGEDKWYPFKHVFMIGMHNGAFPTNASKSSLNLLKAGSFPTNSQFERFVFLDAIINTNESLWISYPVQTKDGDGSNNLPSLFVKELSIFLNKHYKVNGQNFENWNLNSYTKVRKSNKVWQSDKLLSISYPTSSICCKNIEISTHDLAQLARNPIGFYLQKKHFVTSLEKFESVNEDFFLSPLNKAIFIRENIMLGGGLNQKQLNDLLPIGIFQDIAMNQINKDMQNFKEKAKDSNIDSNEFIDIELSRDISQVVIDKRKMYLPPLTFNLENKRVSIVGKIKNAHPKGMILFKENTIYERIKNWPTILLFNLIAEKNANFSKDVFFLKSNVKKNTSQIDADKFLKEFVSYYLVASETVFPLTSSFALNILKNDLDAFHQSFHQLLSKKLKYQDPFEKWFVRHFTHKINPSIFSTWSNYLNHVFYPVADEL